MDVYTELKSLPVPVSAQFQNSKLLRLKSTIQDYSAEIKRTVVRSIHLSPSLLLSPNSESNEVLSSFSPTGSHFAVLRSISDPDAPSTKKRVVEIWAGDTLKVVHDVTSVHGAFHSSEYFSTLSFSPSEDALLYTAEANDPALASGDDSDPYAKYRFVPDFGEDLQGFKRPTTFLLRWSENKADSDAPLSNVCALSVADQPSVFFVQAVFASEKDVFATGYEYTQDGRILGIRGCFGRPVGLWKITLLNTDQGLSCAACKLATSSRSCRSPRVWRDNVFWISNETGVGHVSCVTLHSYNAEKDETKLLVDSVWEPSQEDGFPGLWPTPTLATNPFLQLASGTHVALHSSWSSRQTILLVSAQDGGVKNLTPDSDKKLWNWTLLCTDGKDLMVCTRSAPTVPTEVVIGRVDNDLRVEWTVVDQPTLKPEVAEMLKSLDASIIAIPRRYPVETIILKPKVDAKQVLPCVSLIHGGPHKMSNTAFLPDVVALALHGFVISQANYTGSTGYGEKYVRMLHGRSGSLDVEDCLASVKHLIDLGLTGSGPGKQFLWGTSHGGFVSAHLIGQYPDFFSAAVLSNLVISCGEIGNTDIPDWFFKQFSLDYGPTSVVTPPIYEFLFNASPIAHVDSIRAPVLLFVGLEDRRVSQMQTVSLYHALKGRGKTVELMCVPKAGHLFLSLKSAKLFYEAGRDWIKNVCH